MRRAMRNFAERARLFLMRSASIGKIALRLRSSNVGAGAQKQDGAVMVLLHIDCGF